MPKWCVAVGCKNHDMMKPKFSFYRFPKDVYRFDMWVAALGKFYPDGNQWQPTNHSRICNEHFITGKPNRDPTHPDYVPSIFACNTDLGVSSQQKTIANIATKRKRRCDSPVSPKVVKVEICSSPESYEDTQQEENSATLSVFDENQTQDMSPPTAEYEDNVDTKDGIVDRQENESDASADQIHSDFVQDLILECSTVEEEPTLVDKVETDTDAEQIEEETYSLVSLDPTKALLGFSNDHTYLDIIETENTVQEEPYFSEVSNKVEILTDNYTDLRNDASHLIIPNNYVFNPSSVLIQFLEFYQGENISLKLAITIQKDLSAALHVHHREIEQNHCVWKNLPTEYKNIHDLSVLLAKVMFFSICIGNSDPELQNLLACDSEPQSSKETLGYRDGYYNEETRTYIENSTIRSDKCLLLVDSNSSRCKHCCALRRILLSCKIRKEKQDFNMKHKLTPSQNQLKHMSRDMLIAEIEHQKVEIRLLQTEITTVQRQYSKFLASKKKTRRSKKLDELMASMEWKVMKLFPEEFSKQRMFWTQQCKAECSKKLKNGMRWDPIILKWCSDIMSISKEAFKFIKESEIFLLPKT